MSTAERMSSVIASKTTLMGDEKLLPKSVRTDYTHGVQHICEDVFLQYDDREYVQRLSIHDAPIRPANSEIKFIEQCGLDVPIYIGPQRTRSFASTPNDMILNYVTVVTMLTTISLAHPAAHSPPHISTRNHEPSRQALFGVPNHLPSYTPSCRPSPPVLRSKPKPRVRAPYGRSRPFSFGFVRYVANFWTDESTASAPPITSKGTGGNLDTVFTVAALGFVYLFARAIF